MKKRLNLKRWVALTVVVVVLGTTGAVFAATAKTPAEIAAGLTGKTVEAVTAERAAGKTYGTIAKDAGKLDEFKAQMLEQKKIILDQRVKDGIITQQQADELYSAIKTRMAFCDGTGTGSGMGMGRGRGMGMGAGMGRGAGMRSGGGLCGGAGCGLNLNQ